MATTDITKAVDLLQHAEGTGPLRAKRPVYADFMPPCNSTCPAGENIQAWLAQAQEGKYEEAFQILMEDNPFPSIMGRVCVKPCESGCNRNHIDETVNIHAVERFIGDEAIRRQWPVKFTSVSSGKKVMVVGSGPAGLSAAYHLARMGHHVEIFEAGDQAGGLLRTGVPDYRLPKKILDAEIARITKMGVLIHFNNRVNDLKAVRAAGNFDAVFLAIGAQLIHQEEFAQDGSVDILDAFTFFNNILTEKTIFLKKHVLVYGGGKLALYLARILLRLEAHVTVCFPGDKKMMPAYDYETDDALAEGVDIQLLKRINSIAHKAVMLEKMQVVKGKAEGSGEFESLPVDFVILANKQESDSAFLRSIDELIIHEDGTIPVNAERQTECAGVFAGGDMLPGENRSSTIAIGQGKKAARYIDAYLMGRRYLKPEKHATAGYRKLHMWYKTEAPLIEQDKLQPDVAVKSFDEIVSGLSEAEAGFEAQRCLSCGNCFECDGCYGACPEDAIIKLGQGNRYKFNYSQCTGCAVCFEQCPCHAIEMIPEPLNSSADVNE